MHAANKWILVTIVLTTIVVTVGCSRSESPTAQAVDVKPTLTAVSEQTATFTETPTALPTLVSTEETVSPATSTPVAIPNLIPRKVLWGLSDKTEVLMQATIVARVAGRQGG